MHTMRLAEKGSCVPTLPRPRVVRGQAVKPDLREGEVLSKVQPGDLSRFHSVSEPVSGLAEWV